MPLSNHMFRNNLLLSSPVENQLAPMIFFLYFPTENFEFSFNRRYKIGWPPRHLNRVFLNTNVNLAKCQKVPNIIVFCKHFLVCLVLVKKCH